MWTRSAQEKLWPSPLINVLWSIHNTTSGWWRPDRGLFLMLLRSLSLQLVTNSCIDSAQCHWYYRVITIVQRYTRKYHEFVAAYHYECAARVVMPEATNEWCFHGIPRYYGNNAFIIWLEFNFGGPSQQLSSHNSLTSSLPSEALPTRNRPMVLYDSSDEDRTWF